VLDVSVFLFYMTVSAQVNRAPGTARREKRVDAVWGHLYVFRTLARRVKSLQAVHQFFNVPNIIAFPCISIHGKASTLVLFRHLLKRYHAMSGL